MEDLWVNLTWHCTCCELRYAIAFMSSSRPRNHLILIQKQFLVDTTVRKVTCCFMERIQVHKNSHSLFFFILFNCYSVAVGSPALDEKSRHTWLHLTDLLSCKERGWKQRGRETELRMIGRELFSSYRPWTAASPSKHWLPLTRGNDFR